MWKLAQAGLLLARMIVPKKLRLTNKIVLVAEIILSRLAMVATFFQELSPANYFLFAGAIPPLAAPLRARKRVRFRVHPPPMALIQATTPVVPGTDIPQARGM